MSRRSMFLAAFLAASPMVAMAQAPEGFANPSPIDYAKPFLFDGAQARPRATPPPQETTLIVEPQTDRSREAVKLHLLDPNTIPKALRPKRDDREITLPVERAPEPKPAR